MPNINHALIIEATAQTVYDAITSQEGLSAWWTPDTEANKQVNSTLRFHFGAGYFKEMVLIAAEPFEPVKWSCIKGADEWVGTNLSFKLIPGTRESLLTAYPEMLGQLEQLKNDTATLLVFSHDDWRDNTLMFAECSYTWGQFLRSLKLFCETGKGKPWPNQHRTAL
nr:SRPBCC domain-containing protein [uncultured Mucilaginibacter sp.]